NDALADKTKANHELGLAKQETEKEYQKAANLATAERQTGYARTIPLAFAEWRAGNAGPAQQLLSTCPRDLRGWEWHYLRRLFGVRQLATLESHSGNVHAVAFSPDSAQLASAGADGVVTIRDRRSLRIWRTLRGHAAGVTAIAFSSDGKSLASGSADGAVRVWDVATGDRLAAWQGHTAAVTALAFDPTSQRLASAPAGPIPAQCSPLA